MENSAQEPKTQPAPKAAPAPTPVTPSKTPAPQPPKPNTSKPSPPPIPSVDPKAPLKIEEETADDIPKIDYGKKLFTAGLIFCAALIACILLISFFWIQTSNQTQKVVTVQQSK